MELPVINQAIVQDLEPTGVHPAAIGGNIAWNGQVMNYVISSGVL
jgi:hypothetical protein